MKKALSVFLSLLMVITTISVVFTIPASAAGNTVYVVNENFDSLPEGEITTNTEVPSGNGWIRIGAASYKGTVLNPQTYADIDYATGGFTAASPNNVIRFGNWQAYGYVFDVEPNTTYTVNAKTLAFENTNKTLHGKNQDHNTRITAVDITGATGTLSKTGSGNGTAVKDATTQFSNKMAYSNVALTTGSNVVNQWVDRTLTFTTAPSTKKMVLLFTIEHNTFKVNVDDGNGGTVQQTIQYAGVDNGFLMDDLVVTCEAKPTVKAVTYGADTKNGGEAWVVTDVSGDVNANDAITYKARPYESALFDGFYSVVGTTETKITDGVTDNGDGSYTLTNRPWNLSENIIAKFEALTQNLWPEPSFEGYKSVTTGADLTTAANLLYRGGGKNYDHQADYNREALKYTYVEGTTSVVYRAPSQDNWSATSYGRVAIIDAARVSSVGGTTPYSGKKVMTFGNKNGHGSYKVIEGLDKNTTYTLSYWVYYDATGSFNTTNDASKIVGAPTDENGEVVYTYMNDGSINVTAQYGGGQTTLTQTAVLNNAEGKVNTWVEYKRTFNTGDFTAVLVPFYPGSTANFVYVDHVSLYKDPVATTPNISSQSNFGSNDGIVYDVTGVYYEGDTFTATAMPYDNATFTGFYVDDVKVETGVTKNANGSYTALLTYNAGKTYTAKFSALKENIWPADPAPSSTTPLYKGSGRPSNDIREIGANGWTGQSWATIYNVDNAYIATLGTGLKAFAGDTAYYFGSHNGHNAYRVVRGLKTNTDYTLTYWIYDNGISANKDTAGQVVDVTKINPTKNDAENNTGVNYGITGIATGATMIEVSDMYVKVGSAAATYPQVRPTQSTVSKNPVQNAWYRVERTFNTGANTDFLINFGNAELQLVMYDHVALYETPIAITPTVTVDDGGMNAGFVTVNNSVYLDGETFGVTAYVYDIATFDGWYVNGEKVSSAANYTLTYKKGNTYVAKYNAEYKNIVSDSSYENLAKGTNLKYNAKFTWGEAANRDHTIIDTVNMVAIDGYAQTAVITDAQSYNGKQSFLYGGSVGNGHNYYKLISVEPQTNYNLSYYYYQTADNFFAGESDLGKKIIGIDLDYKINTEKNPNANTGETGEEAVLSVDGNYYFKDTDYQKRLDTKIVGEYGVVGNWTKLEFTFNSGDFDTIGVPFHSYVASNKVNNVETAVNPGTYIDNLVLYAIPDPMTISMGSATGGHIMVNGAPVDSYEYAAGTTATFSIDVTPGNVFVGWFDNATLTGEPLYTATDLSITATEGTTLYPKIIDNNIVVNGDMENLPSGSIESQSSIYGWSVSTREAWYDILGVKGSENGISPYAGTTMLKVSGRNNSDSFWYAANLKKNTTYTVSFKAAFSGEWAEGQSYFTQFAVVSDSQTGREEVRKEFRAYTENYSASNYKYGIAGVADGWKSYSFTFNSANLEKAKVLLSWTCANPGNYMYLDDFAITETVNSSVSIETLNPFGESVIGSVGGKAEIIHSSKEGEYFFNGQNGTAKATLKAMPFDNNVFLGWYVGDTLVSDKLVAEVSFNEAKNYVAKFASFGFAPQNNIYNNQFGAGFENGDIGVIANVSKVGEVHQLPLIQTEVADGEGTKTVYTPSWPDGNASWTGYGKDTYGSLEVVGEKSFEGQYSLAIKGSLKGEAAINRITGLTADTDYTLSFWYFIPEALVNSATGKNANYLSYVGIGGEDSSSNGNAGHINNDEIVAEWLGADENTFGQWTKYSINFNSGDNTTVYLSLVYVSGGIDGLADTQPLAATNFYMDNFELYARADLNAAAQKAFEISAEREGVAIRAANPESGVPQALRFKARIAKERFTAMTLGADYTVVEYGTLAMNAAYIEGSTAQEKADNLTLKLDENGNKVPYTNGGKTANVGVTYNAKTGANKVFGYKDGKNDLIFTAALTGIGKNMEGQALADAYRTKFIVRTYAIVELADGTRIVVLDNNDGTYCASVLDVANKALEKHNDKSQLLDATTLAAVETIIDICGKNEATPDPGVASSYSVSYNPSTLADGSVIDNFFINDKVFIDGDKGTHSNSRPKYYDSDKSIRMYAGNTLTLTTAEGYYIESVVIGTLEDYPYGNATTSTGVASTEGLATTVTGINSSTFVLTTPAATRITSILVNYKYGTAPDPVYPEIPDPEEPADPNTTEVNASDLGLENGESVVDAAITVDESNVVAVNGGEGTNSNGLAPKFYTSDNTIRAYAGNTLTFTAQAPTTTYSLRNVATSKKISSIILTYGSSVDANATANVGSTSYDEESKKLTITGIDAREVVISFTAKAFIKSIKIITEDITPCEEHTYTDNCDVECNVCFAVRNDAPHAFASDCDTTCDCGATREVETAHTADACATVCDLCGAAVVPTHKFAGDCDTTCDCGETREATAEHQYTDDCDADCDVCSTVRDNVPHVWTDGYDAECDNCSATRIPPLSCDHANADACVTTCPDCNATIVPTHKWAGDCDTVCDCGETREVTAEHTYPFVCSTECTVCGATREADHDFTNGDCVCGEPAPTTVTVNTNIGEYATANGWTDSKQYTTITNGNLTFTAVGGSNTGKYYTNGNNWRIYQGEDGKVVITVAPGYTLVSVKVTYANENGGVLTFNGTQLPSGEVISVNGTSVELVVGNTGSSTKGQARISAIEVVYDIIPECADDAHVYASDCATECSVCGKDRVAPHAYVSDCDTTCDCGATREVETAHTAGGCATSCELCNEAVVPTHADDEVLCDTTCDNCGVEVVAKAEHSFDDGCDTECNNCGATREATHEDDALCDTTCSNCGATVEATAEHTYDDNADAICNDCGFERDLACDHAADEELCDTTCSVCGVEVEATAEHTWTNACDTTCDVCDTVREQDHVDTVLCDTVCSTCGATVAATAEHSFDDGCDTECNNCGATRAANHEDDILCDTKCSNCDAEVEATAEHNYVDGKCTACGADKPTSTTVEIVAKDLGIASNANVGTKKIDGTVITLIGAQGTHGNSQPVYNSSSLAFRCYKGNLFTIRLSDGYIIDSIIITTDSQYKMSNATISAGTIANANTTTATITGINASELVINCSTDRVYIKTITIIYKDPCSHANDQIKCDTVCSECGMAVVATEEHTFDDGCDTDCNLCNATREANHEDDVLCDEICSNCGAEVEATAEHTYDDNADAICNDCGFERVLGCDHADDDALCDTTCSVCGNEVEATAEHSFDDGCDTECNNCGATREATHEDDVLCDTKCSNCGATVEATAEHNFVDGKCACGEEEKIEALATFNLGANGDAKHADGNSATTYSETVNGYKLSITGGTKMYTGARDAKGNSCLKLGTGSAAASFTFTVANDVNKVVIYVAKYKTNTAKIKINGGTAQTLTKNSDNGEYDMIVIDTTTNKTVKLETVSGGYRAMVNTIEFWAN